MQDEMPEEYKKRFTTALPSIRETAEDLFPEANAPIAELYGTPLLSNRGIPLNLDWVRQARVNTSALERRAQTHVARRTVKKEWQAAWLLRAITCMDLTTLSGDDTDERPPGNGIRRHDRCGRLREQLRSQRCRHPLPHIRHAHLSEHAHQTHS